MTRRPIPRRSRSRRRDTVPPLRAAVKGGLTLAVVATLIWFGITSYNGVPFRDYATLYVDVPEIGNLNVHDPVRIAGVQVGQVMGESVSSTGRAHVRLQLNPGTQVPADTGVAVRANGLLGARYVQLIPGISPRMLRSGATITGSADALSFGVPEALDTFDAKTRQALPPLIDGVATGLLGHGAQLNDGIHAVTGGAARFTGLARAILAPPGAAQRLLPALDSLLTPLGASRAQLAGLLVPAARTFADIADERAAVRATLTAAPPALSTAQLGLGRGRRLLSAATDLADAAVGTLPLLPSGLDATAELMRTAPAPLQATDHLLGALAPAVPDTLRITAALSPTLTPLKDALANAGPMIVQVGRHGCDIVQFGVTFRSMTGFGGVGNGPLGPNSAGEFRAQLLPAPEALAPVGSVAPPLRAPYPAPCQYPDTAAAAAPTSLRSPGGTP